MSAEPRRKATSGAASLLAPRGTTPQVSRGRRGRSREGFVASEAQAAHAVLIPAQVVGELVADGALDLRAEQLGIVAEVALQGVLVDDDAIRVDVAGDGAAHVLAVGVVLVTPARDDHWRA